MSLRPTTNSLFGADSPLMRPQSFHRGENCTDVAIPLIAVGGCRAVSAGVLARHFAVTPPAVLKWFGSTAQMWDEIAACIGRRWYAHTNSRLRDQDIFDSVALLVPSTQDEVEWTRVWLSMLELGRHHELVGKRMAQLEEQELTLLYRATDCRDTPTLVATMVVVRGLRQMVCATNEPLDLETAQVLLRRHVTHAYVERGIPEPVGEDDVLSVTRRMTYSPARRPGGQVVTRSPDSRLSARSVGNSLPPGR